MSESSRSGPLVGPLLPGYRQLTEQELTTITSIKRAEEDLGALWRQVIQDSACDQRWAAIAKTRFEEGFMAFVRSVAQPDPRF